MKKLIVLLFPFLIFYTLSAFGASPGEQFKEKEQDGIEVEVEVNESDKKTFEKNKKAIVKIESDLGQGTGFLVSKDRIISVRHLFSKKGKIVKIEFYNNKKLFAKVIHINLYDYSVLNVLGELPESVTTLDLYYGPHRFDKKYTTIGYPMNKGLTAVRDKGIFRGYDFPKFTMEYYFQGEVHKGASGSPLIVSGTDDVIGILSKKLRQTNNGIFIPIFYLQWNLNQQKKKK